MSIYHFLPSCSKNISHLVVPQSSSLGESCAIIGDNDLMKTSLLFEAAVSIASSGDQVIFITSNRSRCCRRFKVVDLPKASFSTLNCIKIVYIEDPPCLLQYLCEFHTKESFPAAIIIDDIQYYVSHLTQSTNEDQHIEAAMVKLFAILEDTTAFISQKKGEVCHRLVSASKVACPKSFLKKYFRELWYLTSGEKEGEYFLTDCQVPAVRALLHLTDREEILFDKVFRLPSENSIEGQ